MQKSIKVIGFIAFFTLIMASTVLWAQQPTSRLCDFSIEKIYLTQDCRVAVTVKNLGPGAVPDAVWAVHTPKSAGVYLYRNGTGWGEAAIWQFDPAKKLKNPDGTATFISNLKISGTVSVKAVVDFWKTVPEANEANNSFELKLTCSQSGQQQPDCRYTVQKDQNGQEQYLLTGKDCQGIVDQVNADKVYGHGDCDGDCRCDWSDNCRCRICRGCCSEVLKKLSR